MTYTTPTEFEWLMLRWPCQHCHAKVGDWCKTRTDRQSQFLHAARFYKAKEHQRQMGLKGLE